MVLTLDARDQVIHRELYNLARDPGERNPSTASGWKIEERVLAEYERLSGRSIGTERELDEETAEGLRALGYLEE